MRPGLHREIVGESGRAWIVDETESRGGSNRGTWYVGWEQGASAVPTVWVVRHWLMKTDSMRYQRAQQADREHLNRAFEIAQTPAIAKCDRIVRVFDRARTTDFDDYLFIVSELAETTLRREMGTRKLQAAEIADVQEAVISALETLHRSALVHCDVTPSNILCVRGQWKLGDLGATVMSGEPIVGLPGGKDRRYVPPHFSLGMAAEPWLDSECLRALVAELWLDSNAQ